MRISEEWIESNSVNVQVVIRIELVSVKNELKDQPNSQKQKTKTMYQWRMNWKIVVTSNPPSRRVVVSVKNELKVHMMAYGDATLIAGISEEWIES